MKNNRKPRILNVDDDDAGRYAITRILRQAGFEVQEAATGREALRLAEERPDLILLDVNLPDIGGLEVCRQLRANQRTAAIPVVHLSATFVGSDDQAAGLEQGADGYLTQPVEPKVLVATINAFLRLKAAEQALRESEEQFRVAQELSPDGFTILRPIRDAQGRVVDFTWVYENAAIARLNGTDPKAVVGQRLLELFPGHSGSQFLRAYQLVAESGEHCVFEADYCGKSISKPTWFRIAVVPTGGDIAILAQDITEHKRAEEQIHASLREKEILLLEVHHRVKNNMQVISGLLDLQASSSKNPELIAMFHESQSRIQAMSMVHEKLYASKDFARIDLTGYVRTLSQDLFQAYKINPGKIDLIVQTDGDVYVDISKAIPCGLILNELISNALKHAFPGDGPGELRIIIRETKNTEMEIVVRDNGIGLPDDVDIHQPRTVGLHLVNGLVKKQLYGQIEVRRDAGTEVQIKFPL